MLALLQVLITSIVVPKSQSLGRSIIKNSSINIFENFIKPMKFNDTVKGLNIYSDKKSKDGKLENIYLKKNTGDDNFQITYAKKGVFENRNNNQVLVLFDGETISAVNKRITNFSFSVTDFGLNNLKTNTTTDIKTQENSTNELFKCVNILSKPKSKNEEQRLFLNNCKLENLENIFKELYKRLFIPLYIPVFVLASLLILLKSKENINFSKFRILIFIIGFLLIIFSETTIRFINNILEKNIVVIILPIIFLTFLYLIFWFQFKFKFRTLK